MEAEKESKKAAEETLEAERSVFAGEMERRKKAEVEAAAESKRREMAEAELEAEKESNKAAKETLEAEKSKFAAESERRKEAEAELETVYRAGGLVFGAH